MMTRQDWLRIMAPDSTRKVIERLATSEKVAIVVERLLNGNMRVTSGSWDNEKVILRDEVLEVRNVDGRLHVARKPRRHDEWDPPITPYDRFVARGSASALTVSIINGFVARVSAYARARAIRRYRKR